MPVDFGLEDEDEIKEGSGSNLGAVLREPIEEKPKEKVEKKPKEVKKDVRGEIKSLLVSADKAIQRRNHKSAQISVRKVIKLLEEL